MDEEATRSFMTAFGAAMLLSQYGAAALITSAAERGAIDPERVFSLLETLANGCEACLGGDPELGRLAALMLRGVRGVYDNLRKIPPGAGRA